MTPATVNRVLITVYGYIICVTLVHTFTLYDYCHINANLCPLQQFVPAQTMKQRKRGSTEEWELMSLCRPAGPDSMSSCARRDTKVLMEAAHHAQIVVRDRNHWRKHWRKKTHPKDQKYNVENYQDVFSYPRVGTICDSQIDLQFFYQ